MAGEGDRATRPPYVERATLGGWLIGAAVAVLIVLAYFALSGNWTNLGNPIGSIIAIVAGLAGFAVAVARDELRRRGRRRAGPPASG